MCRFIHFLQSLTIVRCPHKSSKPQRITLLRNIFQQCLFLTIVYIQIPLDPPFLNGFPLSKNKLCSKWMFISVKCSHLHISSALIQCNTSMIGVTTVEGQEHGTSESQAGLTCQSFIVNILWGIDLARPVQKPVARLVDNVSSHGLLKAIISCSKMWLPCLLGILMAPKASGITRYPAELGSTTLYCINVR